MLLGVDVGGTFTDAVLLDGGTVHTAKLPTTPGEESAGVMTAIGEVLNRAGAGAGDVESFAHGMTVGTNALLEERGARTALIATRGFSDLLEIGRQDRPDLYRLCTPKPAPLVEPELRFEADERIGPEGVLAALAEGEPERLEGLAPRQRRRVGRDLPPLLLPRPLARATDRPAPTRPPARPPRLRLARGAAALPRVRALRDHRDRRLPEPAARPLPRTTRRGDRRGGAASSPW